VSADLLDEPPAPSADEPAYGRRGPGPRTSRRGRERLRRRRRNRLVLATAGVLLAVVALVVPLGSRGRNPNPTPPTAAVTEPAVPDQATLLLVRHATDGGPATGTTLLAAGPGNAEAAVIFLPVGTLLDLPGHGLDRLGLAQQYGGGALVEASVENALGVAIDHVAAVSDSGLAALLGRTGGLTLDVPDRLIARADDGTASVRFEPGAQVLDGPRLVEYWAFVQRGEDELAALPRQQAVLARLFTALREEPALVDRLVADGAPQLATDASAEWLRGLFAALGDAAAAGRLTYLLLPVEPFGGAGPDGGATFRLRDDEAAQLVENVLADSRPGENVVQPLRVQVLNGVGVPGVGQEVDRRLEGLPLRVVRTDNARSFDFTETRILIYDESEASRAAARRVRDALGVGTILLSRQSQTVVDLTIVVGADLLAPVPPQEQPS
jgi:hypothetical protein